jgi:peptide/nickel transport system permease protein
MHSSTRAFDIASAAEKRRSSRTFFGRLRHARGLTVPIISAIIILLTVIGAVAAPWITPHNPEVGNLRARLTPPTWTVRGEAAHPLGTDHLGRDVLARLLYGSRITLLVGLLSVVIAGVLGILLGLVSGYYGGIIDRIVTIIMDIQMSFPFLTLAIALVAVLGPGLRNVIVVLGVSGWVLYSRIVRGEVMRLRESEYVEAARAIGARHMRIMFRTILPNILAPVIIVATFAFAQVVIVESSLSFLGIGVQPPTPTWGTMLSDAREYLQIGWWLTFFPGGALMFLVLAINMFGDWLRDYLDPHLRD